jgi:hypothetical protein
MGVGLWNACDDCGGGLLHWQCPSCKKVWCKNCAETKLKRIKVSDPEGSLIDGAIDLVGEVIPGAQTHAKGARDFFGIYDYQCKCGERLSGSTKL